MAEEFAKRKMESLVEEEEKREVRSYLKRATRLKERRKK